jgi:hypothetical protein
MGAGAVPADGGLGRLHGLARIGSVSRGIYELSSRVRYEAAYMAKCWGGLRVRTESSRALSARHGQPGAAVPTCIA